MASISTTEEVIDPAVAALPPSQTIPTVTGVPFYTMRTRLDGLEYTLRFAWNELYARWFMDIFTDDGVRIAVGVKLVTNWPLLRFMQWDERIPQGEMIAVDLTGDGSPPGLYDFGPGKRVALVYYPKTAA